MSDETTCGRADCDRPADGWFICHPCAHELERALTDTGWMLEQLDLVAAGQTRYTDSAGKVAHAAEIPLPVNLHAANTRERLEIQLNGWALVVLQANMDMIDEWPAAGAISPRFAAAWLATRIAAVRLHPLAGEIADGILREWGSCQWTVDRPPGKKYLGTCKTDPEGVACGGRIYQRIGKPEARCDTCGGEYGELAAALLQAVLLERLNSHLATAAEIAELSTYLDLSIDRTQVRKSVNQWVRRKQLVPAQHVPEVKFRFLEARVLLENAEKKRRENLQCAAKSVTMK